MLEGSLKRPSFMHEGDCAIKRVDLFVSRASVRERDAVVIKTWMGPQISREKTPNHETFFVTRRSTLRVTVHKNIPGEKLGSLQFQGRSRQDSLLWFPICTKLVRMEGHSDS